jgi:hypothetical protein
MLGPAEAATAERTATPSAAPISWLVVSNPDARPARSGSTSLRPTIDTIGKTSPMPSAKSTKPGRMSAA